MKLSSSSLHQSLFCHMKTFDCNNARSGDLFPLFPHRLCSARDHFTPFRMVKIYHSNADIQNVLFLYVVASHCSTLHDPQCTCPIEWSFLCSFTIFTRQKKTINVEDAAILEHLLKPKGCKTFTFHPMMINTLGKVPVYSFDVCDHIPSWCTSPFYLVYGAAWETYGQRKTSGKKQKNQPMSNKDCSAFLSTGSRTFFTVFQ